MKQNRITTDSISTGVITSKQINLDPTARAIRPKGSRGTFQDWVVGACALATFLTVMAIAVGSLLWLALTIWTSVLSMM